METKIKTDSRPMYVTYAWNENSITFLAIETQTDFVSRNNEFRAIVDQLAMEAATADHLEVDFTPLNKFKEKYSIILNESYMAPRGHNLNEHIIIYRYHDANRLAMITFKAPIIGMEDIARPLAVQCVAGSPIYLSTNDVEDYQKILTNAKIEALSLGKPEQIANKIAEGKVRNQMKEIVFLEQTMYNCNMTVAQYIKEHGLPEIADFILIK